MNAWLVRTIAIFILAVMFHSGLASAAETLRWKFSAGQTLLAKFTQQIEVVTLRDGMNRKMTTVMEMEMRLRVEQVDREGAAQLKASWTRVSVRMSMPGAEPIAYDSASEKQPTGELRAIADSVGPIIGADFLIELNDRGEILAVELSEQAAEALEKTGASEKKILSFFSEENMNQIFRQSLGLTPDRAVEVGQSWKRMSQTASPLGLLKQQSTFTFRGTEQRGGRPLKKITVETHLEISKPLIANETKVSLKEQQQSGVLYFDAAAGRVIESETNQQFVSEIPYRGKTITSRVTSLLRMTLSLAP